MTPFRLGSIIALYEYKVILQAAFWRINPFDQFGVELGKEFANALLNSNEKNLGLNPETLEQFMKLN
jgi:glucose-6-phosphate isomerase